MNWTKRRARPVQPILTDAGHWIVNDREWSELDHQNHIQDLQEASEKPGYFLNPMA